MVKVIVREDFSFYLNSGIYLPTTPSGYQRIKDIFGLELERF